MTDRARVFATLAEPVPERFFADYGPLVRWLESELEAAVLGAIEQQVIAGDGVVDADSDNVFGVLNTSGTVAVPFQTDLLTTLRRARLALELLDEQPTGWVLHPTDAANLDLLRESATSGGFLLRDTDASVLGGLPRVISRLVPPGTAILGDWRQAVLAVRENLTLAFDRSGDNFRRNLVTARTEGRFGFAVTRPQAFAEVTLTAA